MSAFTSFSRTFSCYAALALAASLSTACVVEPGTPDDDGTNDIDDQPSTSTGEETNTGSGGGTTTTGSGAGGSNDACTSHTQCASDEICLDGGCDVAWGRIYRFTIVSASLPGTNPNTGDAWDPAGGAPDPYVAVYLDGVYNSSTTTIDDTFDPMWNQYVDIALFKGGVDIAFFVWDEDIDEHDGATGPSGDHATWLGVAREGDGCFTLEDRSMELTICVAPL